MISVKNIKKSYKAGLSKTTVLDGISFDIEEGEFPDISLDQATGIVTDLATMREIASKPPQAAQVQP